MTWLVFAAAFLAYLRALPPGLAPWRDTGEMAVAAWTLGVAHPTSYPLFVLLGRAAACLPLGTGAYRLNLLSAVAGAGAVAALFAFVRRRSGVFPALAAAAWLALTPIFWTVSSVSEMYSLWVLCAVALTAAATAVADDGSDRWWPGFCFAAGLALTNRLDLLLWAPGLLWIALSPRPAADGEDGVWAGLVFAAFPILAVVTGSNFPFAVLVALTAVLRARGDGAARRLAWAAGAALAGFSVYAFLPIRSATAPFLDWNHPAAPANFLDSLLRTRYGGTLDLISRSYAVGENFVPNLRVWGAHLWDAFGPIGLAAALVGAAAGLRADRRRWLGRAACWWWSGPVFLFLANLPPNSHALAIVEPHYLLSDLALVLWAADGAAALAASTRAFGPALAAAALVWPLWRGVPARVDRRADFSAEDFARNAFASAPPGAVVVVKKDVPLYALWQKQTVRGARPDLRVVAQGLSGTPWYQADWSRRDPGLALFRLSEPNGWSALAGSGRPVLASMDAELPGGVAAGSRGLLGVVGRPTGDEFPWALLVRRGEFREDAAPDFFHSDLIDEYASASFRRGVELQSAGRSDAALVRFEDAWRMNWDLPEAAQFEAYAAASAGRWSESESCGAVADLLFARKLALAADFRALPALVSSIRREAADAATQRGVALERLGRREEAEAEQRRALALFPLAQTHYDLAVLEWGRDWGAAESELNEALRLDPGHAQARDALARLKAARKH